MTVLANIKTILEADSTLLAIATGGIYDYDETGRLGISRSNANTAAAFDSNEVLKPCVLLKLRSEIPDNVLVDDAAQYVSARAIYEVWFYQDDGFDSIDAMTDRVFALLHAVQVPGTFQVHWIGNAMQVRDDVLDATLNRSDYMATVKRSA